MARAWSSWSPGRSQQQWAEGLPQRWPCTHLQERVDLLFFLSVHISFLKELEIGDVASTWSDMPRGMFLCGSQGDGWAQGSEMRGRDSRGGGMRNPDLTP